MTSHRHPMPRRPSPRIPPKRRFPSPRRLSQHRSILPPCYALMRSAGPRTEWRSFEIRSSETRHRVRGFQRGRGMRCSVVRADFGLGGGARFSKPRAAALYETQIPSRWATSREWASQMAATGEMELRACILLSTVIRPSVGVLRQSVIRLAGDCYFLI